MSILTWAFWGGMVVLAYLQIRQYVLGVYYRNQMQAALFFMQRFAALAQHTINAHLETCQTIVAQAQALDTSLTQEGGGANILVTNLIDTIHKSHVVAGTQGMMLVQYVNDAPLVIDSNGTILTPEQVEIKFGDD